MLTRPARDRRRSRSPPTPATSSWRRRRCPAASDAEADEERRKKRKDAGVTAVLHEAYPVRYWDHDLGPAVPHLFWAGQLPADEARPATPDPARAARPDARRRPAARRRRGLHALPRRAAGWPAPRRCPTARPGRRSRVVLTDTADGETRVLVDDPLADVYAPRFSPDGALAGLRAGGAVHLRRAAGLHAAARRRGRRRGARAHPRLRPVAERARSSPPTARRSTSSPTTTAGTRSSGCPLAGGAPVRLTGDGALQRPAGRPRRQRPLRPAVGLRLAAGARPPGPGAPRCRTRPSLPNPGTLDALPGHPARGGGDRRRRRPRPVVAGRCPRARRPRTPRRCCCGSTAGPLMSWNSWSWRWCPWVHGRPRLRRAAAQPGAVAGLRAGLRPARLGRVGRRALHRPDGRGRRRRAAARHRRLPDRGDGRLVRRLHGQLGGHPDRPVQGDRHPRQPLGPRRVHRHHGRGLLLGEGVGRPAAPSRSATSRTRRTATPTPSARRCWSSTATRTTGCRSARRCGSGTTCRSAASRRSSSTSPTRTTGC